MDTTHTYTALNTTLYTVLHTVLYCTLYSTLLYIMVRANTQKFCSTGYSKE